METGERKPLCNYFGKKGSREFISPVFLIAFKLATNNTLGYDIPRVGYRCLRWLKAVLLG